MKARKISDNVRLPSDAQLDPSLVQSLEDEMRNGCTKYMSDLLSKIMKLVQYDEFSGWRYFGNNRLLTINDKISGKTLTITVEVK